MECQADQVVPPSVVVFDQRAPSVPRAKTSIVTSVRDVAAGTTVSTPPRDCRRRPGGAIQCFHQRAPSVPFAKRSRLFCAPLKHAAGALPSSESIVDFNVCAFVGYA